MKKNVFIIATFLFLGTSVFAQKIGEKIEIESSGSWYAGKILKISGDKYFVTYTDWGSSWDEWVTVERIRGYATKADRKFHVGDRVEAEYGFIPTPGTIIEVGENKYNVKFDTKAYGTKWCSEGQIKML